MKRISDLKNDTDVLKEVDKKSVYLTGNGNGEYGILTMAEIDELDRYRAAYALLSNLQKAEQEGWIDEEELYEK